MRLLAPFPIPKGFSGIWGKMGKMQLALCSIIFLAGSVYAAPDVRRVTITDVKTMSFSVVWETDQPSIPSLEVYDENHNEITHSVTIINESSARSPAEDLGVMKITVSDLDVDTVYLCRTITTSKIDGTITTYPSSAYLTVRTQISTEVVDNDMIYIKILKPDGVSVAMGTLIVAEIEGSNYPITGWQGDGIEDPYAYVDLKNLFDATSHRNLELSGGENIKLKVFGSSLGILQIVGNVPDDDQVGSQYLTLPNLNDMDQTLRPTPAFLPRPHTNLRLLRVR